MVAAGVPEAVLAALDRHPFQNHTTLHKYARWCLERLQGLIPGTGAAPGMHKSLTATVREQEDRRKEQHDMSKRLHDRLKGLALRTDATGDLSSSMPSTHPPPGAYIREILPCLLLRNQREKTRV
jgi:hypothetical protein